MVSRQISTPGLSTPAIDTSDLSLDQLVELERRLAERDGDDDGGGADGSGDDDGDGDESAIVLPWWQHPVNIATMVLTSAILAAMIGWMVGDSSSRSHNDVDTGFLQDMRLHHEQAVDMSVLYLAIPDTDPSIRSIAHSISRGQSIEVGRMIQLLRGFGESEANEGERSMEWMGMATSKGDMPGMASEEEFDELARLRGVDADRLFAQLMIDHHEGGIHMAEFAAENGKSGEVRAMATAMAHSQRDEIAEIEARLD